MRWWRTHSFHDDEEAEGHGWSPTPPRSWPQSRPTKRELEANGCRTSESLLFGVAANHRTPFVEDLCEGGKVSVFLAVMVSFVPSNVSFCSRKPCLFSASLDANLLPALRCKI